MRAGLHNSHPPRFAQIADIGRSGAPQPRSGPLSGAARTLPDEREVREAHLVAEAPSDVGPHRIEQLGAHGPSGATARTVNVLVLAVADQRVEPRSVPEMHVAQQSVALERLEVAIDRRRDEVEPQRDLL